MSSATDLNHHLSTIMDVMQWSDDAFVPVANEENQNLMEQLRRLVEAKENRSIHLKQLDQRVKLLTDHHKNAEGDVVQNLVFCLFLNRWVHLKRKNLLETSNFHWKNFENFVFSSKKHNRGS